jgi:hypothetical protein
MAENMPQDDWNQTHARNWVHLLSVLARLYEMEKVGATFAQRLLAESETPQSRGEPVGKLFVCINDPMLRRREVHEIRRTVLTLGHVNRVLDSVNVNKDLSSICVRLCVGWLF